MPPNPNYTLTAEAVRLRSALWRINWWALPASVAVADHTPDGSGGMRTLGEVMRENAVAAHVSEISVPHERARLDAVPLFPHAKVVDIPSHSELCLHLLGAGQYNLEELDRMMRPHAQNLLIFYGATDQVSCAMADMFEESEILGTISQQNYANVNGEPISCGTLTLLARGVKPNAVPFQTIEESASAYAVEVAPWHSWQEGRRPLGEPKMAEIIEVLPSPELRRVLADSAVLAVQISGNPVLISVPRPEEIKLLQQAIMEITEDFPPALIHIEKGEETDYLIRGVLRVCEGRYQPTCFGRIPRIDSTLLHPEEYDGLTMLRRRLCDIATPPLTGDETLSIYRRPRSTFSAIAGEARRVARGMSLWGRCAITSPQPDLMVQLRHCMHIWADEFTLLDPTDLRQIETPTLIIVTTAPLSPTFMKIAVRAVRYSLVILAYGCPEPLKYL